MTQGRVQIDDTPRYRQGVGFMGGVDWGSALIQQTIHVLRLTQLCDIVLLYCYWLLVL